MIIGTKNALLSKQVEVFIITRTILFLLISAVSAKQNTEHASGFTFTPNLFHHPPKVLFLSRPFEIEVFSNFSKNETQNISLFYRTDAQPRYIEQSFNLDSRRYIFTYDPKQKPTEKISYFFTIELKNGSVFASPIDSAGMVTPITLPLQDPIEYYKKRSMRRE
tara:strand:- start:565 stop:1056 length:492 start_codon:yes stop_codon:yes gene_type:complete